MGECAYLTALPVDEVVRQGCFQRVSGASLSRRGCLWPMEDQVILPKHR